MNKIDLLIKKLLGKYKKNCKIIKITEEEILSLCKKCKKILLKEEILLTLEAPFQVCGDIHGQYHDLIRLFCFGGFPPDSKYLFLGDYVDRGKQSIETMCLLLAFKVKFPDKFFILRGNHESSVINRIYGFYEECKKKYSSRIWKIFCSVFNCLPIAAIINQKIFCVHGGISPLLTSLNQIKAIQRPTEIPDYGLMCDLLWADPDEKISGWGENERGVSFIFGKDVVDTFLKNFNIDLICRAHQLVDKGFQFFGNQKLVTIFSAPNYCGEFGNFGAMMFVNKNLTCSFYILYPF